MPSDDFMISIIKADFGVDLIGTCGESALFAAKRKGGTETISTPNGSWRTNVMGVWHFVTLTRQRNLPKIHQWHIPRYEMAAALRMQDRFFRTENYPEPILLEFMPLPTKMHGRNKLELLIADGSDGFHLPELFVLKMKEDLPLLEKALEKVRERNGQFYIPRLKTPAGHPVESESEKLLRAIAFEKLMFPRMTAKNFGIYSAFCTYRDFDTSIHTYDMLEHQFQYSPDEIPDELHELFMKTQRLLLSQPVWGRGIKMEIEKAAPILAEGMASLTSRQRVQFILMNGMHGASLFLALATLLSLWSFDEYANYICQGFQPDSLEEQERRKETAYICLYGKL